MIWLFSCFFHKGFPISKDQCVQMAKEKTKPWLYPNPMRKGAGRAPMVGQVKPWRDWPKKYFTKIRVFFFWWDSFFILSQWRINPLGVWGVCKWMKEWKCGCASRIKKVQKAVHIFDQRTGQDQLDDLSNTLPVPGRRHNLSIVFLAKPKLERFHQVKVGKLWCWPWKAANDWPLNWSEKIHHFQQPTS